jgi:hypothetical protein
MGRDSARDHRPPVPAACAVDGASWPSGSVWPAWPSIPVGRLAHNAGARCARPAHGHCVVHVPGVVQWRAC